MCSTLARHAFAAVAAVATTAALATPVAGAQSFSFEITTAPRCDSASPAEVEELVTEIHEETNREREAAGQNPVKRLDSLDDIAQTWSSQMANENRMYHNPNIRDQVSTTYPGQWRSYGENVLQNWCGKTGKDLVTQWMNSLPHRLNLINPAHTHLGVGVAVADNKKLFATQNFVSLR